MKRFEESMRVLKRDKHFAPLIRKHGPPEFARYFGASRDVFPALLRSIIYQQLSGHAARAIHERVLALFPNKRALPEILLKIPMAKLRKAGLSKSKITYVRDLANKCIDGVVDEKKFSRMSSEEIVIHLTQVNGIGEWTAHMLLIFTLYRPDILPVGDLAIRKGFQTTYKLSELPSKKEMEKLAQPWRAHASTASWYLWRVADGAKKRLS